MRFPLQLPPSVVLVFVPLLPLVFLWMLLLQRFVILGVVLVLTPLSVHTIAFLSLSPNCLSARTAPSIVVVAVVPPFVFLNVCGVVLRFLVQVVLHFCLQHVVGHLVVVRAVTS